MCQRALQHVIGTFGWRSWVARSVVAVAVMQPVGLHLANLPNAAAIEVDRRADLALGAGGDRGRLGGVGGAAVEAETLVGDCEGRRGPINGDSAALCGPLAAVPDAGVRPHWLIYEADVHDAFQVAEHADGGVVDVEYHQVGAPLEVVVVILLRGVEPQVYLLLAPAYPIHEDIRVQQIRLPGNVAQKLEIQFAVVRVLRRQLCHEFSQPQNKKLGNDNPKTIDTKM